MSVEKELRALREAIEELTRPPSLGSRITIEIDAENVASFRYVQDNGYVTEHRDLHLSTSPEAFYLMTGRGQVVFLAATPQQVRAAIEKFFSA